MAMVGARVRPRLFRPSFGSPRRSLTVRFAAAAASAFFARGVSLDVVRRIPGGGDTARICQRHDQYIVIGLRRAHDSDGSRACSELDHCAPQEFVAAHLARYL